MRSFRKTTNSLLKDMKGFTLIEVMIVIAILGILASIGIANFNPLKEKAYDTIALSDTRNLVETVVAATLSDEDVDYTKGIPIAEGGAVGEFDTAGNPRSPVFVLSLGVRVQITGASNQLPGNNTQFSAIVYHTNGTPGKQYLCDVDESTGVVSLP